MEKFQEDIDRVLKEGNWMVHVIENDVACSDWKWGALGEWLVDPKWYENAVSDEGISGQTLNHGGYLKDLPKGKVVFCEYDPSRVVQYPPYIKVKKARILRLGLPDNLNFPDGGALNLQGCDLKGVHLPSGLDTLNLVGCDLKGVVFPEDLEDLYVNGCDLDGVELPDNVGLLGLGDCDVSELIIPTGTRCININDSKGYEGLTIPAGCDVHTRGGTYNSEEFAAELKLGGVITTVGALMKKYPPSYKRPSRETE